MPDNSPQLSLIIAAYNRPEVLGLVFAALGRQTFKEFETVIADDGSGPEVKEVVENARQTYAYPINHVWHEDAGWRKNKILNDGIRASGSEYLVFIDGDCLPSRNFLLDHWVEREKQRVLLGRRVEMSERWAQSLTMEKVASGKFERIGLPEIMDGVRGKALRLEDGIRIANRSIRKLLPRKALGILGSNFSIHKEDILSINGFDETYDGPGHGEDSDIQYRLGLIGVTGKSLRNAAIQFHVYHTFTRTSEKSARRFEEVKKSREPRCKIGLEKP
ncbi:MAG: glycosyltransferase [Bacteroidetes bacterium]|nr:glycosyltransferase [Bacteroidota bacterium]